MRLKVSILTATARAAFAVFLLASLAGVSLAVDAHPASATTQGDQIVSAAASQKGVPYCDNGGSTDGPSYGNVNENGCGPGTLGFDCTSLVQYAVYQVTGIVVPTGSQPAGKGTYIPPTNSNAWNLNELLPGDAVFWSAGANGNINNYNHSGIYAGNDKVWDAISVGNPVMEHTMEQIQADGYTYVGAMRFWSGAGTGAPPTPAPTTHGYDLVGSDGGVFVFGGGFYGSLPGLGVHVGNISGIVATATDTGYFLVGSDGGVFAFNAPFANSLPGLGVHVDDIVGIVPTLDDRGYFLVGRDGGVFSFNARFANSLPGIGVHVDDITGIAATADDQGYWLVGADGAVYAFGDARFYGTAPPGAVAITATHDGGGYWVVGANGTVTPFGDAGNYSDLPALGVTVNNIVGIVVSNDSWGYNLIGDDGGVFSFGDAANRGSLPGLGVHVNNVVGAVPT